MVKVTEVDRERARAAILDAAVQLENADSTYNSGDTDDWLATHFARHRIAALEEAAGVAEGWKSSLRPGSTDRLNGHNEAARSITEAIRALIGEPPRMTLGKQEER